MAVVFKFEGGHISNPPSRGPFSSKSSNVDISFQSVQFQAVLLRKESIDKPYTRSSTIHHQFYVYRGRSLYKLIGDSNQSFLIRTYKGGIVHVDSTALSRGATYSRDLPFNRGLFNRDEEADDEADDEREQGGVN